MPFIGIEGTNMRKPFLVAVTAWGVVASAAGATAPDKVKPNTAPPRSAEACIDPGPLTEKDARRFVGTFASAFTETPCVPGAARFRALTAPEAVGEAMRMEASLDGTRLIGEGLAVADTFGSLNAQVYERMQDAKRDATLKAKPSPLHCVAIDARYALKEMEFRRALAPLFNGKSCPSEKPRVYVTLVHELLLRSKGGTVHEIEILVDDRYFIVADPDFDTAVDKVVEIVTATIGPPAPGSSAP